ncbi:MAG TPA: hypothetical protein VHM20_00035 [Gammaproteobacteria bacterium]|jgi:hypothetical protein|nr:hypothetical protein [Gammaproteobacteria bacterium]
MSISRFSNIKFEIINLLHKYYFDTGLKNYFNNQIISFLKSKKGSEEYEVIKIRNDLSMRLLSVVIFNIDEQNRGRKKDLLFFIENEIYKNPRVTLTAFPLELKTLRQVKKL